MKVSPETLRFRFMTYYLAQSHRITAVVLDQEGPAIVRKVKGNKDGCPVHLDICSDEMRRCPLAWPPQSEMHRTYVLYAEGGRPSQQSVDNSPSGSWKRTIDCSSREKRL